MDAVNRHRVATRKWRRWSKQARAVFNELYGAMTASAWAFQSPKVTTLKIPARLWRVTAWNAAWIAADAVDGFTVVVLRDAA
jgi:hypothetical protein